MTMNFSTLSAKRKRAWLFFALFIMGGFVLIPGPLSDREMQVLIAGTCFGVAAMIAMFMLGKKEANEVG